MRSSVRSMKSSLKLMVAQQPGGWKSLGFPGSGRTEDTEPDEGSSLLTEMSLSFVNFDFQSSKEV
jgi:hypothetical protein